MALENQDDEMYAGDNKTLEFEVVDDQGAALNITGASIEWTAWDGDQVALTKTTLDGIVITNAAAGLLQVILEPEDTYRLPPKSYRHGVALSIEAGAYETVATGQLLVKRRVRV